MAALGSRQPSPGDAAHGGNQPSASREGSAHGLLCYAQVVRDYSQDSNLSEELQQMVRRCGWVAPFLLLLAALFVQSAGLYVATCDYVRRIDEVSGSAVGLGAGELRTLESLALEDPAARLLRSSKLAQSLEGFLAPELCVDLLSSLVILIWLAWVVSSQDLRLWTRLLFAGSVLATLKGFLAWSTVFPDAAGMAGCKSRLGEDGLMYYRQLNLGESIGPLQALQDVLLLTVRGLWMMGRSAHQHICADSVFSTSTSSCALFSLGLYDAVREVCRHSELRPERRATVLSLTGVLLLVVILADLAMAVSSRQHYAIDVLLALPLTLLVYGNPAVALATDYWVQANRPEKLGEFVGSSADPVRSSEVTVAPCCLPFCCYGGLYHLQEQTGQPQLPSWTEERQQQHLRTKSELSAALGRAQERRQNLEADIKEEWDTVAEFRAQRTAKGKEVEEKLKEQLAAEEALALAAGRSRLASERQALKGLRQHNENDSARQATQERTFSKVTKQLRSLTDRSKKEASAALEATAEITQRAAERRSFTK